MWYVVQTMVDREEPAIEKCRTALDREVATRVFTPKCQLPRKFHGEWQNIEKVAFPGYVFIESDSPAELEKLLMRIPSVVTPVRIGGGFYPIRTNEEMVLRKMMDANDCIRSSVGYIVDEKLVVEEGPLQHFAGLVKKMERHKRWADVEVILFEECKYMRVGLEVIARLTAEEYREMRESA